MVFALPGPRLLRWLGIEIGPPNHYSEIMDYTEVDEELGGICYYPTNG